MLKDDVTTRSPRGKKLIKGAAVPLTTPRFPSNGCAIKLAPRLNNKYPGGEKLAPLSAEVTSRVGSPPSSDPFQISAETKFCASVIMYRNCRPSGRNSIGQFPC